MTYKSGYALLAFWASFFYAFRIALTYLSFQGAPKLGAFVQTVGVPGLFLLLAFAAFLFRRAHSCGISSWPTTAKCMAAYVGFTGISLAWTQADSTVAAAGYWFGFAAEVGIIAFLLCCESVEVLAGATIRGYVWGSIPLVLTAWTSSSTSDLRMGDEVYLHPNAMGIGFGLAALFAMFLSVKQPSHKRWKGLTLVLFATLLYGLSKTSIISFICAAAYYLIVRVRLAFRAKLKILVVTSILVMVCWGALQVYLNFYFDSSRAETITGRTVIWAKSLDLALEQPWFGHGVYAYRSTVPPFGEFEPWQAHNEFLQQFFAYGVAGVLLSVIVYISFFAHLRASPRSPQNALAMALLVYFVLHGLTEANHIELSFPVRLMLLLAVWVSQPSPDSEPARTGVFAPVCEGAAALAGK